ncbi:hypothetical protein LSH36_469g01050 [Paralvinella palmiformis]|uniref:ubiquitinyl hydrolase 1 n=1 Tax=Paralvinella palmiformis TaxID=53620 RepID=A0AAD9MXH7_9ANNE|nr:hypothetical protein LSH36_469g01050 [Paralvinella palmiformis]
MTRPGRPLSHCSLPWRDNGNEKTDSSALRPGEVSHEIRTDRPTPSSSHTFFQLASLWRVAGSENDVSTLKRTSSCTVYPTRCRVSISSVEQFSNMDEEEETSAEIKLLQKHKKERKELQAIQLQNPRLTIRVTVLFILTAETQKLKHAVSKGDKKKRKEVMAKIAKMEEDQAEKHKLELEQLNQEADNVADNVNATHLDDNTVDVPTDGPAQMEDTGQKRSKAQKRRERKAAKEREREERIKNQDIENLTGARHVETQKLKAMLSERGLAIYDIPSDGNCLYAAVADQLSRYSVKTTVESLRVQAANYMRQHQDDLLPFLSKQDTGEPYTPDEYLEYCDRVEHTSEWGGQLELQALSTVLEHPIEVVQADAPPIMIGEDHLREKLILSYHHHMYGLGEHYNSVVDKSLLPVEDDDDDGFS